MIVVDETIGALGDLTWDVTASVHTCGDAARVS